LLFNEMQLNSLKGQLNPHFLFNTFNTLYGISLEFPERTPDLIMKETIDPAVGLRGFQARKMAFGLGIPNELINQAASFMLKLYDAYEKTDASLVEIAGGGMVFGMRPSPVVVGRERQDTDDAARPVVDSTARKERPMAAVVLDHEQPQQESGGGNDEDQAGPEAVMNRCPCGSPEQRERDDGDDKLESAASGSWLAISGKDFQPAFFSEKLGLLCGSIRVFGSLRVVAGLAQRGHLDFLALAAARRFDHRVTP
jgi:hypothetical protein